MNRLLRLHDVQDQINTLKEERNQLIREIIKQQNGHGCRELAHFTGLSPAQVSRISRSQ